jgi:hypothetical protein
MKFISYTLNTYYQLLFLYCGNYDNSHLCVKMNGENTRVRRPMNRKERLRRRILAYHPSWGPSATTSPNRLLNPEYLFSDLE